MFNVVLGDIIGSRFEFFSTQETDVRLFHSACSWTDDTVCTYAVSKVCEIIKTNESFTDEEIEQLFFNEFKSIVSKFPMAGYGKSFFKWTTQNKYQSSNSKGNGCLMRITPIIIHFDDWEKIKKIGYLCTKTSHNHEESFKTTECYLKILFTLKKTPNNPKEIVSNIFKEYGYDLVSVNKYHELSGYYIYAEDTLPRVISCYLESNSFEETCKNVLFIGSDTDTNCAIAGALCELTYGVNNTNIQELFRYFDHKSFFIINHMAEVYAQNFTSSIWLTEQNKSLILKLKDYQAIDVTAAWDPLELPSDEEYYKYKPNKYKPNKYNKFKNWIKSIKLN
ncbi:hypothetical protein GW796_10770 [archaeon]|nr:hypothetical protein [archaeon]NCQ52344.1 hypothetical protein [archaeon]